MKKEFDIDNSIYSENIINQAISDFEDVSEIKFEDSKIKIKGESEEEINEVFNELMNYIVGLINE